MNPRSATMVDLKAIARRAMLRGNLLPDFSPAAVAETNAIATAPVAQSPAIRDLRALPWASIDNDTSRDLDQLSVAEPMRDGTVKIFVAIADVDAVVRKRSAIDEHAQTNTTTVYTDAEIFPMLPAKLSTDLTSLGQGEERLAMVVEMWVTAGGTLSHSEIYRASVLNHAKLAYDSVAAWLDGTAPMPPPMAAVPGLDAQIRVQDRVAHQLRGLRHQHGALTLQTREARAVFEGDTLSDLRTESPNRAKELIEDFMIAANGVTASYLAQAGFPSLRRVLRSPERWARIVTLAQAAGSELPTEPSGEALADFLTARRKADPEGFADLSLSVVKLLGRGEYVLERRGQTVGGHFGLAVSDYAHSTAPNRRFPDLITQRLVKAALEKQPVPYSDDELSALARHCSEQEVNAVKVERQVRKSAAASLLASRVGDQFDGLVTGASQQGTWVRILHPVAEGKLVHGFEGLDVGDRVRVELIQTDIEHGFIDFVRAR